MKRTAITIILSSAVVALLLLALPTGGQKAQAAPPPPPEELTRVVGASKATCTPRRCRYEVTCEDPSGESVCVFALTLHTNTFPLLTRAYPSSAQDIVTLNPGETRKLKLKVIKQGRRYIKRRLEGGKRSIKGGWEAWWPDFFAETQDEEKAWDAVPGFDAFLGLVFQLDDDTKIKLKK